MASRCEPIPTLQGDDNLEEWKLKVVGAFATIGLADYLFSPNMPPPSLGKLALGMDILLPSLKEEARYLTKAGWDFTARNQDPKKLYQLALDSIPKRKVAVPTNDELLKLLRIEMADGGDETIDDYIGRIKGHRDCLRRLGYVVEDELLVRATLHGMVATGREDIQKCVNWLVVNELAPGNLTFEKLERILRIAEPQDIQEIPVGQVAKIQPGHPTTWDAQREDHLTSTSHHFEENTHGNEARYNPVFQEGHSTHAAQSNRSSSNARPGLQVNHHAAETSPNHPSREAVHARGNGFYTTPSTPVASRCRSGSASNNNHQGYPIPNGQLRVVNTPATTNNHPSDRPSVSVRFVEGVLPHECRHLPTSQRSVQGLQANANVTSLSQAKPGEPQNRPGDASKTSTYPGRMSKSVPIPGAWPMSPTSTL